MEKQELAQEVDEESTDTPDEGSGSIADDFKQVFGEHAELGDEDFEPGSDDEDEPEEEDETTSEAVSRVFDEAKGEGEADGEEGEAEEPESELEQTTEGQTVELDGITPPARLTAEEKKVFANLRTKTMRKAVQKMFANHESGQTKFINQEKERLQGILQQEAQKLNQQYTQAAQQVHGIRQAVEPYLDKLTFNGKIPISQGIGELAATHAKLSSNDPKVAVPEIQRIAGYLSKRFQVEPEQLFSLAPETVGQPSEVKSLQTEIEALRSQIGQLRQQPQIDRIRAEVNSVRQEVDGAGNLMWPELQDPQYVARVNPLVEQIMRANPQMGYGAAHKQAVLINRGQPQINQAPRLPAATTGTNGNKPSGGSSGSVRGRSATPSGKVDIVKDAPQTGSIKDDWEYINRSM